MIEVVALGVVVIVVVVAVAWPLVRPATPEDVLDTSTDAQRRRLQLREERDLALEALKELELDHATHHVGDEDYQELVAQYRARAAAAIRALDEELGTAPAGDRQP